MTHANGERNGAANGHSKTAFADEDVAIRPNAPQEVPALLKKIAASGEVFIAGQDEEVRADLLDTARSLVYALETPREAMIRVCWAQVTISFVFKLGCA